MIDFELYHELEEERESYLRKRLYWLSKLEELDTPSMSVEDIITYNEIIDLHLTPCVDYLNELTQEIIDLRSKINNYL